MEEKTDSITTRIKQTLLWVGIFSSFFTINARARYGSNARVCLYRNDEVLFCFSVVDLWNASFVFYSSQVIRDRRWKEITGAFRFPSSITSASFVLRKYYLSLLYHFEQVYYFRKEEPSVSAAGVLKNPFSYLHPCLHEVIHSNLYVNFFLLLVDSAIGIVDGSLSVEVLDHKGTSDQCSGHSFSNNDF